MKGSLLQLVAFGAEDLVLTADPDITFFNTIYKQHSVFSIESIQLNFTDIPQFNSTSVILIKKNGDLLSRLYLEVILPYDENLTDSYWTNRVGFNLIKKVELYIGKRLIDRLYGIWMHIWVELTHSIDMKNILNNMIGTTYMNGYSDGLSCAKPHKLQIPLLFSFCRNSGLAIPLNAIRNNRDISLKFYFEKKENCVQIGELPTGDLSQISIWADYVFLDVEENRLYLQRPLEYIIEVTQHFEKSFTASGTKSVRLPFILPCKELTWIVYNINRTGDKFTDFTYNNSSMVRDVQLFFNTTKVFSSGSRNYDYFNYIQPYQHHKNCPDLGINSYSFAIYPEELSPSGFFNFKTLKTAVMNINTFENGFIHIFAFCYNILKIDQGDASLVYVY